MVLLAPWKFNLLNFFTGFGNFTLDTLQIGATKMYWPKPEDNNTQSWSEGTIVPGLMCHVCGTPEKVFRGTSESFIGINRVFKTSFLAYWQLCSNCHDQGWQVPKESNSGHLTYINSGTGDIKIFKAF